MNVFLIYFCVFVLNVLLVSVDASFTNAFNSVCRGLTLKNGKVRYRQRGRFVRFSCNMGFELAGERYSPCIAGEIHIPKCVRNTCYPVRPPYNGLIYSSHSGAVLHFYCKPGFESHGPSNAYCDGRVWDTSLPACLPTNTTPSRFCDFETPDLCGWTFDLNHDFDWTRENFKTPSGHIGTGPSYDHTKGDGNDGYYMYIESSSRNENDTARLISPVYKTQRNTSFCFEFYYHMYGRTVGSLRAYLKKVSQPWNFTESSAFFVKSGNQGNQWIRAFHYFDSIDDDFQIIIEGIRGNGYISDIAIDDVKLIENCSISYTTTIAPVHTESPETPIAFDSCRNRCGVVNGYPESVQDPNFGIMCYCDENCYSYENCCPDYIALCVLGPTDGTSTDISNDIPESNTETLSSDATLPPASTERTTILLPNTTLHHTTKQIVVTTRKVKTTLKPFINNTKIIKPSIPPLIIMTPPPPPIQKTFPNYPKVNKQNQNEVIKVVVVKNTFRTESDAITVPSLTYATELPLETVIPDKIVPFFTPDMSNEIPREIEEPMLTKLGESKHLQRSNAPDSSYLTIVVTSITIIITLSTITLTIVVIRCKSRCRRLQNSPNGDSQSDVRFLTSDEILNLSLPDDYNL